MLPISREHGRDSYRHQRRTPLGISTNAGDSRLAGRPTRRPGVCLGSPPFSETGAVEAVSIERQTEIAIEQMKLCLEAAGSSLDKIAKCNVYADDPAHFETINRIYERYFQKDPPARIFICVSGWPGPFNLEIDCIAAA